MKRLDADSAPRSTMNPSPVPFDSRRLGYREIALLLIASGFALLMMDLGNLALITGCGVVALWVVAMIRGPRPSPILTFVYGAGLFVTCFWWPQEGWWILAIALTWIGVALIVFGIGLTLAQRIRRS
ncbi:MAG: hypothetical protein H0V37_02795 [Chloroflexia bacterium]|nr:hypothetical protein [Chloroflexia bacterium]